MPRTLTEEQLRRFRADGYLCPVRAVPEPEAIEYRRRIEAFEAEIGMSATAALHIKCHLYLAWLWDLSRHPNILGAASDLLGTDDILVLASRFWIKEPGDRKHVTWHQDLAYFGIEPEEMVTFWLALTPATRKNGGMRFIPGSHAGARFRHTETYDPDNLLSRGQKVEDADESAAIYAELAPGELSIHHGNLLHNSEPNASAERRIGFAWMFMPTRVRSTIGRRSATLISGADRFGHWDHDPYPRGDRDPAIWDLMHQADQAYRDRAIKQSAEAAG